MDAVYTLGIGSRWQNNELRYSLRSLEKYVTGIDRVYIVGPKPDWLTNVEHLPFSEHWNKERNIMEKVRWACQAPELSEEFLFLCDDYFALKPQNAGVPSWAGGSLKNLYNGIRPENVYRQSVLNTIKALQARGLPTDHYDIHVPIVYNKVLFQNVMNFYNWGIPHGYVVNSLYANSVGTIPVWLSDVKLIQAYPLISVVQILAGRPWWSVGDRGLTPEVKELLAQLYPQKSRFEM